MDKQKNKLINERALISLPITFQKFETFEKFRETVPNSIFLFHLAFRV